MERRQKTCSDELRNWHGETWRNGLLGGEREEGGVDENGTRTEEGIISADTEANGGGLTSRISGNWHVLGQTRIPAQPRETRMS